MFLKPYLYLIRSRVLIVFCHLYFEFEEKFDMYQNRFLCFPFALIRVTLQLYVNKTVINLLFDDLI